jgi:hypothetical protein
MIETFIITLHFLTILFNFGFCFLILKYSKRELYHLFLAAVAFFSGIYPLTLFLMYITRNPFWSRFTHIGYFIPFFFVLFTLALKKASHFKIKAFLYFLPLPLIIYLSLFTNLVMHDINVKIFPTTASVGSCDFIGRIYLIILLTIGILNLVEIYRKSQGFQRTQLKYFLLGAVIYTTGGIITVGILPLVIPQKPIIMFITEIAAFGSIFWVGLSSYAVLRYRLMDIGVVVGRGAVYFFSFATMLALAFLLIFLNNQLVVPLSMSITGPLILVIGILLFQPVFRFYEKIAEKYFYYTFYNTQIILIDLGKKLIQILEIDKVSPLIVETLIKTIKIDKISFAFKQPTSHFYQFQKTIGFDEKEVSLLIGDTFLCQYLEKTKKILVKEELLPVIQETKDEIEKEKLKILNEKLNKNDISLVLPLFQKGKIVGLLFLGEKLSGNPYSKEDIDLLENLSCQMAISLQNSLLYEEIKKR